MTEKRLFGTDGIRGEAGAFPLDPDTVDRLGWALATVLARPGSRLRLLVGRDTRESGRAIEEALTRGLHRGDVTVTSGGVLSTPAVAFLARSGGFDAGIVISASHNPFRDNGIKIFSGDGLKLGEGVERQVESLVLEAEPDEEPREGATSRVYPDGSDPLLRTRYLAWLRGVLPAEFSFDGREVVLDCANGAASVLAPEIFRRTGAKVTVLSGEPDGRNINAGCGALHPEAMVEEVRARGAFLGAAFDGDADRCILADEGGHVRDGDDILAVAATALRASGVLADGSVVVGTVMANLGLELYLRSLGVELVRTAVGDRHVLDEMLRRDSLLGGEQSGHVIFREHASTGDGLLTALRVARIVTESGRPLSQLAACWRRAPQVLRNVRVRERVELKSLPGVAEQIERIERELDGRGRLLVRYSGTEPVLRLMLEGDDLAHIEALVSDLAAAVERALG